MLYRGVKKDGMINMYGFFAYNLPGTILIFGLLCGIFYVLREKPISRLVRKYSFFGIFFFMLLDGNVESITYFTMR
jgi:hypothetical protein